MHLLFILHEFLIMCSLFSFKQVKGVSQNINYTTIALLPVLTSLFDHIAQHQFGDDVICEFSHVLYMLCFIINLLDTAQFISVAHTQWMIYRCHAIASCVASTL